MTLTGRGQTLLGWVLAAGLSMACLWPVHDRFLYLLDEGNLLSISDQILDGQVPYRDFALSEPPAHFYLVAGLQALFGRGLYPLRLAALVVSMLTAVALSELTRHRLGGIRSGWVGAFAVAACCHVQLFFHYYWTSGLLAYASLMMVLRAAEGAPRTRLVAAGFLATASFFFKQNAGAYGSIGVFLATLIAPSFDRADAVRRLCRLMLGVLLGLLLAYALFRIGRIPWQAFWASMFGPFLTDLAAIRRLGIPFPGPLSCIPRALTTREFHDAIVHCFFYMPVVLFAAILVREFRRWRRGHSPDRRLLAVVAFASVSMALVWPFFNRGYLIACLPVPLTLLAAWALEWSSSPGWRRPAVVGLAVLVATAVYVRKDLERMPLNDTPLPGRLQGIRATREASRYVSALVESTRTRLRPEDELLAIPIGGFTYAVLGHACHTEYPAYVGDRLSRFESLEDLRRLRPRVVVFVPYVQDSARGFRESSPEFMDELRRDYELEDSVDGTEIWARRER